MRRATKFSIAQEHTPHYDIDVPTRRLMSQTYDTFDAIVTVSKNDADAVRESLSLPSTEVISIANSIPAPNSPPSHGRDPLIIAAGRVVPVKRFENLVHAFARLADDWPDWNVRIYGKGSSFNRLRELVHEYRLSDRIRLMGANPAMGDEWTKGSIAVSTSDSESFGMTIVEAMRAGVPVISTDLEVGPREIITHDVNGLLIKQGDVSALEQALRDLMASHVTRERLSRGGLQRAEDYSLREISKIHTDLFYSALRKKGRGAHVGTRVTLKKFLRRGRDATARARILAEAVPGAELFLHYELHGTAASSGVEIKLTSSHAKEQPVFFRVKGKQGSVRVPAETFGNDARWTVSVLGSESPKITTTFAADGRSIVSSPVPMGRVRHVIPYVSEGVLKLRAWKRNKHTEVKHVDIANAGVRVAIETSFLLSASASIILERRSDGFSVEINNLEQADARHATFSVPVELLVRERLLKHDDWDFVLSDGGTRSKISRFLDDIAERKPIDVYPSWSVQVPDDFEEGDRETVFVRLYYTPKHGLAANVVNR